MATHTSSDYDGLHVQSLEQVRHQTQPTFEPAPYQYPSTGHEGKEAASTLSSPYYGSQQQSHYSVPPQTRSSDQPGPKRHRNPWGLSPLVFAAIVALITAVIVGGAVGGGLAATKNNCSVSQSGSGNAGVCTADGTRTSSTPTSTSMSASTASPTGILRDYIVPSTSQVESLANDCLAVNGATMISAQGTRFKLSCPQAIYGSSGSSGVTLSETVAYSLEDCVNACSLMNFWRESTVCNSVTWDSGMAGATASNFGGNCWLFNDSTTYGVKANSTSARLQE